MAQYDNLFGGGQPLTDQQKYYLSKIMTHDYNFRDAPNFNNPDTGQQYSPTSMGRLDVDRKMPSDYGSNNSNPYTTQNTTLQNSVPSTRIDNGIYPSAMPTINVTGVTDNGTINTYDRGNSGDYPTLPTINVTGVSENGTTNTFQRNSSNPLTMSNREVGQVDNPYLDSARNLQTGVTPYRELPNSQKQPWYRSSDPVPFLGINTDYGAFSLGQAIGSPNGTPGKGLGIVAGAGKVIMGLGRNLVSGIADSKDTARVQDDMRRNQQAYWRSFTTDRSQYVDPNIRYEYGGYQGLFNNGGPLDMDKKRASDYTTAPVQPVPVGTSYMDMDKKRASDYLYNPPLNQPPVQPQPYSTLDFDIKRFTDYSNPQQGESVFSALHNINNYYADGGEQGQDPNQQIPQDQQQNQDQITQVASQLINQFQGDVDKIAQYLQQKGVSEEQLNTIMNFVVQILQQSQQGGEQSQQATTQQQDPTQQGYRYGGLFADGGEQDTLLNQLQAQQQLGTIQQSDQAMQQAQQQGTPIPSQQPPSREQQTINYAMTLVDKFKGDTGKIQKYLKQNGVNPNMSHYLMQYVEEIVQQGDIKQDKETSKDEKSESSMRKSTSQKQEVQKWGRKHPKLK